MRTPVLTRVLVVDDEPSILRALRINLSARNYQVSTASDGASGLAAMARDRPDVMILDLGLPDMDGTEVIRGVRGWAKTPIIVLSVWGHESQKVAALDAGADDYVTKPFGMDELLARLRAAIRRASPAADEPVVNTEDFTVDLGGQAGHPRRWQRRAADPHRVAVARSPGAEPGPPGHTAAVAPGGVGPGRTRRRATTCGSTSPSCGASWSLSPPARVTCSPSRHGLPLRAVARGAGPAGTATARPPHQPERNTHTIRAWAATASL